MILPKARGILVAALSTVALCILTAGRERTSESADSFGEKVGREWLFVVTDDLALYEPGCDAITALDVRDVSNPVFVGKYFVSPGQLAISPDADTIVSAANNSWGLAHLALRKEGESGWKSHFMGVDGGSEGLLLEGSASAFTMDGNYTLVSTPRGLEKYATNTISETGFGLRLGFIPGMGAAAIETSSDSKRAYVLDTESRLYVIDVDRMSIVGGPLEVPTVWSDARERTRRAFMAISPDERYLVVNQGPVPQLAVVDIETLDLAIVDVEGTEETWGLSLTIG